MLDKQMLVDYMSAHVMMHTQTDISRWTEAQLIRAFATLPMPSVSPEDWAVRVYGIPKPPVDHSRQARAMGEKLWLWAKSMTKSVEPEPCPS